MVTLPAATKVSLADFEVFLAQPEHQDGVYELINGEISAVPSNPYASEIANLISFFIRLFLVQNNLRGHVTGADGGYMIGGGRYAPDVAYISYERQAKLAERGYNPNPPELAVEVISDPANVQETRNLRLKLTSYLAAGVIVWVVDPQARTVEIHQPGEPAQSLDENGTLTVAALLPGFQLAVRDIFPKDEPVDS